MDDDITPTATSTCLSPITSDINPVLGLKGSSTLHHISVTYPASKAWNKVSQLVILRKLCEENSNNDGMTERNALITAHRTPMWPCILCPSYWAGWIRNQLMRYGDVVLENWVATKILSFSPLHVTKNSVSYRRWMMSSSTGPTQKVGFHFKPPRFADPVTQIKGSKKVQRRETRKRLTNYKVTAKNSLK